MLDAQKAQSGAPLEQRDSAVLALALRTFSTFDFSTLAQSEFVRDVVLPYLDDPNPLIRREAALTCARLAAPQHASAAAQTPVATTIAAGPGAAALLAQSQALAQ